MSASATFSDPRLAALDGFRVETDPVRERADVILDRPPFNIVSGAANLQGTTSRPQAAGVPSAPNFDVRSAKKCCVHHILPDGKIMPFCSFNTLHRPRYMSKHQTKRSS